MLTINEGEWAQIRLEADSYEGWCRASQLHMVTKKEYFKPTKFFSGKHTDKLVFESSEMWLPLGSEFVKSKVTIASQTAKFKGGKLDASKLNASESNLRDIAMHYLHAPYQWGGKTIAGIDCSGLSQMAFKLCGVAIPRDASQQATEGETVDFLQHAKCGDLAFFDNEEGKINHVGMILDHQTIIHATESSGRVVVDKIDQGGIISASLRKRTHNLRMVRRYF